MAWRHRIALVLLLALTGLPVGGTLCALGCDSSAPTASNHGAATCEDPARSSPGPQIGGQSENDCSTHEASLRQVVTRAAERADLGARVAPALVGSTSLGELEPRHRGEYSFDHITPGTGPPTVRPVVLRV